MANYGAVENVIEWLRGEKKVTLSLSEPEWMERVTELAAKDKAVEIIDRGKHTMCAVLPIEYVTLTKPRKKKANAESNSVRHSPETKASRGKGEVLRKRRVPRHPQ